MTFEYGGPIGGGSGAIYNHILTSMSAFIGARQALEAAIGAHIVGTFNVREEFTQGVFIEGFNSANNNIGPSWGTVEDIALGIYNIYRPVSAYINGHTYVPPSMTAFTRAYIAYNGTILRSLTLDGRLDPSTTVVDDSSPVNNDGTLYNAPTWVAGPH